MSPKSPASQAPLALALLAAAFPALAATPTPPAPHTAGFVPDVTVVRDDMNYDVQADGRYVLDETETLRINTEQGVKQRSQIPLPYSTSLQSLDIVEADTTTKGVKTPVDPSQIRVQQSPQSAGAPMFDDEQVKVVIFPAVQVGSELTVHLRRTQKAPLFPGQFSTLEVLSASDAITSTTLTVKAPASLPLHVQAVDLQGGRTDDGKGPEQVWHWAAHDLPAHVAEPGSVSVVDVSPRVAVSTFASYADVAHAYAARATAPAAVTPAIQAQADQITAGLTDPKAQAEALYRWVSGNIRYVALYLGAGGVVPHAADQILKARYGDCKDHATLLQALLAAKKIPSSPVLVNADSGFWLPTAAVAPGVFNHVITWLPTLKTYVDSTAGVAPFGVLPVTEMGKPALVIDGDGGRAQVETLPLSSPGTDTVKVVTTLTVNANGDVHGQSQVSDTGMYDWVARAVVGSFPAGAESQIAGRLLTLTGQAGTGTFHRGDAHDLTKAYDYTTEFDLPGLVSLPGPGAFAIPAGISSLSTISMAFDYARMPHRDYPMVYTARHVIEDITLTLPAGMKPTNVPKPVTLTSPIGHYETHVDASGNTVHVVRSLVIQPPHATLDEADYQALQQLGVGVMRDLRGQIVY